MGAGKREAAGEPEKRHINLHIRPKKIRVIYIDREKEETEAWHIDTLSPGQANSKSCKQPTSKNNTISNNQTARLDMTLCSNRSSYQAPG
jgi:hypothetical protein